VSAANRPTGESSVGGTVRASFILAYRTFVGVRLPLFLLRMSPDDQHGLTPKISLYSIALTVPRRELERR